MFVTVPAMRTVLAACAAAVAAAACAACGTSYGTSHSAAPELAAYPVQTEGGASVTLGAATVAAQSVVDHFADGEFADVWEHMATDVRQGVSREDFVTFYETCKKPGARLSASGLRMEPDGEAIVRVASNGVEGARYMVYEDGSWNMRATKDFASHFGQPVEQIIREEKAAGLCEA
jgi:hypothetical protein